METLCHLCPVAANSRRHHTLPLSSPPRSRPNSTATTIVAAHPPTTSSSSTIEFRTYRRSFWSVSCSIHRRRRRATIIRRRRCCCCDTSSPGASSAAVHSEGGEHIMLHNAEEDVQEEQPQAKKLQKLENGHEKNGGPSSIDLLAVEAPAALRVKKLSPHAILPSRGSAMAAGYDLSRYWMCALLAISSAVSVFVCLFLELPFLFLILFLEFLFFLSFLLLLLLHFATVGRFSALLKKCFSLLKLGNAWTMWISVQ